jgi:hypothetical protein
MAGIGPQDWIGEDVGIGVMTIAVVIAGWARSRWLQWVGALLQLAMGVFFLVTYAMP